MMNTERSPIAKTVSHLHYQYDPDEVLFALPENTG